ncbi:hypothetical protein B0O79_1653 [Flavobacteriaceae bacterium MAR_2009_75]|nr:hypothetical protein B0O79_1653 [Flavobacteriaceae bacterium MAR_2009_75]
MAFTINRLPVIFLILLLLHLSTSYAQESETKLTKMEEVMASHDEVMDEMPKLSKLINKLQTRANASYEKDRYEKAIDDLRSANKSMMSWMSGFGKRFEADEMVKGKKLTEQKQKWLLEEEKKIAVLKEEIELSIDQAEKILAN